MSYEFYKIIHLAGLITLFVSLGTLAVVSAERRKPYIILHGIATVVMLVTGFGLLAKLGIMKDLGGWVHAKIAIWLIFGAIPVILKRKPNLALSMLLVSIVLGTTAACLAILKPF